MLSWCPLCLCGEKISDVEVEVKIRVDQRGPVLRRLKQAGYIRESYHHELDTVFDFGALELARSGRLLRLRHSGKKWLLTFKGRPVAGSRYKEREEIETELEKGEEFQAILERLGYLPVFAYEKCRRTFRRGREPGQVTLDQTPIGNFLELEGPRDWIDRTAKRLGFGAGDYITKSYGALYLEDCQRRGVKPTNMLFEKAG